MMLQSPRQPMLYELKRLKGRRAEQLYRCLWTDAHSALLLSGGGQDSARYSFIGSDPFCLISSQGTRTQVLRSGSVELLEGDPFGHLEALFCRYQTKPGDLPFSAGGIGYFAYELKNHLEKLTQAARDDLRLPTLYFCLYRLILIYDRQEDSWYLSCYVPPEERDDHRERMAALLERLEAGPSISGPDVASRNSFGGRASPGSGFLLRPPHAGAESTKLESNFTKQEYLEAVRKVRRYIVDGHVYQVNISQRFSVPFLADPYEVFLRMFQLNPAPFFAFLNGGSFQILCTSPERFLLQNGRCVETRPIKGTRPRGKTEKADERLRKELKESLKDEAELSMIVDLLRNDLSKVCQAGTVAVQSHKKIEAYTNVFHLLSIVTGVLRTDRSRIDLLRACFPGGSITGCPKIRAMEIIDDIEPQARSVYTGSIGYLSFHDTMELNIAIRTAIVRNGMLHFNVGGGIVYDSDPEAEYLETLYKGESILKSIQ